MYFGDVTVEAKDVELNSFPDEVYEYALVHACQEYSYWNNNKTSVITSFFTGGRLLKIWNNYPNLRDSIFDNIVLRFSVVDRSLSAKNMVTERQDIRRSCSEIAKKILESQSDNFSRHWVDKVDRMVGAGILSKSWDHKSILSSMEEYDEEYMYWLKKYIKTLKQGDEKAFEELYFSVKRGKGATEVRDFILRKSLEYGALSNKILEKIAKSSPISLRRTIVQWLSADKHDLLNRLSYMKRNDYNGGYTDEDFKDMQEKADAIDSKLILFAPIQDMNVQIKLVDVLSKDNLVWCVPAVSSLGSSWLSSRLEKNMS